MMYLQNIIRFCALAKIRFVSDKYFLGELEFDTFIGFFSYLEQMYSFSETTTYIDWEFEYLTNNTSDELGKFKFADDVQFLAHLIDHIYGEMGSNQPLDDLMARMYWCIKTGNIDSSWTFLTAYAHQAAWGSQ